MSFQVAAFADDAVLPEPPRPAHVVDAAAVAPAQVRPPPRPQKGTAVVAEKRKTPLVSHLSCISPNPEVLGKLKWKISNLTKFFVPDPRGTWAPSAGATSEGDEGALVAGIHREGGVLDVQNYALRNIHPDFAHQECTRRLKTGNFFRFKELRMW